MIRDDRIVADPKVMVGKPVIKGTRLTVEFIMELLTAGWTETQVMEHYSNVALVDIQACRDYAGRRAQ